MKKCSRIIILALVSLQVSQVLAELEIPPEFCVDLVPGHHAHPTDCTAFIYCVIDAIEGLGGHCPYDLHFRPGENPGEGTCTYPALAGCDPDAGGPGDRECAVGDFWDDRVPGTCNRYYRCLNGEIEERWCPDNLHWHNELGHCTTPVLSDCPYPICSENPPEEGLELLPHPTDCNLYYICINQEPVQRACAPGQHFDRVNGWCTTPAEAGCE